MLARSLDAGRRGSGGDMSNSNLGEFEQMVLLAILQLGEDVYGVPIVEEIERRTDRSVARSSLSGRKPIRLWYLRRR